ncbi:MAG: gephyrin-like molybdotransferase Glp [Pseudomonadota bacterium]|nr:gephyrin-like molybdotransferase Glp [Pseudomonadota bacterium]
MAQLSDDCFAFGGELMTTQAALVELRERLSCICKTEDVLLEKALGRITAENVVSTTDVPAYDNAAVDGYAVYFDDISQTSNTKLPINGRVTAGHPLRKVAETGNAYRIFTGAPMPEGPDTVLMQEDCQVQGKSVVIPKGIERGANRRFAGEDIRVNDTIITKGQRLRPQEIGLAASIGKNTLTVYRPLRVALFSTGDEICDLGTKLKPGTIFDSNRYSISALLHQLGCNVNDLGILPDNGDIIRRELGAAASKNDVIITSAGVSTGEEDHIRNAINKLGAIHFWRLAIRPGRPIAFGQIGNIPFIGLPGNPVASMVTFMRFARPALLLLNGASEIDPKFFRVPAAFKYKKKRGRREWVRAVLSIRDDGQFQAEKFSRSGAGILTSMVASDGLVELSEELTTVNNGNMVDFLPFNEVR